MKHLLFVLLTCYLLVPARAGESKPPALDEQAVEAIVKKAMKKFEAPGVAVAIVRGDRVVYLKGHGLRELGKEAPVTPDTLFAIASCSKAFTATAIGFLVQEGKMGWDDPVRKHLPAFRLSDPLADRDVTLRDLLCHRTGVIRHDILWLVQPWGRDEMIRRSGSLKADKPFRSEYGYNNLQFLAAGEAAGRAAGTSWEQLVRSRILDPLGMKATNFSIADLEKAADHARPHARTPRDVGPVRAIAPLPIDNVAPAGAINSNVRDLSAWLRFQLAEGTWEGKPLLKAAILRQTHTPQVVTPIPEELKKVVRGVTVQGSYGLGWHIEDYRGRRSVEHGGSLNGFRSRVLLLPEENIGIAVLTNLGSTALPSALANSLADLILQAPPREWNALYLETTANAKVKQQKTEDKLLAERKPDTKPSLPLPAYAGTYEEPAHGEIRIAEEGGSLTARWGKHTLPADHWHFDTFRLKEPPGQYPTAFGDRLLLFRLCKNGMVDSFSYLGHDFKKVQTGKK